MNDDAMRAALASAFDDPIRGQLVEVLDEAYQVAGMRYDESIGCNGFTFGTDLYQFVRFRFQGRGDRNLAPITLADTSSELELRLKVRDFTVACHRVGASGEENIAECFPSSSGGPRRLARLNAIQLELDLGWSSRSPLPHNVVVAHLGNPENGLEAVYLAIPTSVSDSGKINAWGYTELVWKWDGEQTSGFPIADLPSAVPIVAAQVVLKRAPAESEEIGS